MKPKKVKEDDAPRTIACPHKVSMLLCMLELPFTENKHVLITVLTFFDTRLGQIIYMYNCLLFLFVLGLYQNVQG